VTFDDLVVKLHRPIDHSKLEASVNCLSKNTTKELAGLTSTLITLNIK